MRRVTALRSTCIGKEPEAITREGLAEVQVGSPPSSPARQARTVASLAKPITKSCENVGEGARQVLLRAIGTGGVLWPVSHPRELRQPAEEPVGCDIGFAGGGVRPFGARLRGSEGLVAGGSKEAEVALEAGDLEGAAVVEER